MLHLTLSEPLSDRLARHAAARGWSPQELVERILEHDLHAAEEFEELKARAARGRIEDFDRIMAAVPDVPPMPGDELPPDLAAYYRADIEALRKPKRSAE
jgi:hypothetical protein